MQHLSIERLAELGDVEPTRDEAQHLATCPQCARERAAYRSLTGLAGGERSRISIPLTDWPQLRARLVQNGLLRDAAATRTFSLGDGSRRLLQMAAATLLMVGGLFAGRLSTGMSYSQALALGRTPEAQPAIPEFSTTNQALEVLNRAYDQYSAAATFLAANDTISSEQAFDRFRSRLAFLDEVARSTREALAEAPQDPLINQFYISTLGARDATLQRMGQVVPVTNRLGRF